MSLICDSCVTCSTDRDNFEDVLEATAGCLPGLGLQDQRRSALGLVSNICSLSGTM